LLIPSLRHEAYDSAFRPGEGTGVVPGDERGAHTTGRLGFRVRAGERIAIKGNFGRFLRLPDFIELFGYSGAVLGNPALSPERGRSFDLGIAAALPRPGPALRQASVEATIFETLADDLIVFVQNAQNRVVAQNFGRARIRGVELSLALAIGPRFTGSLNATLQRAVNESGNFAGGHLVPGRPGREGSATAGLRLGPGRATYVFTYVGRNYVDESNTESRALPARYLHDLGYRLTLPRDLEAVFEVKNIGDQRANDVAGFPLPGRSFHGRLSWRF
ncbi:MAG: TonB-dependent receptor, partial [Acidobacteria bacterium]|nr:TonB-dependent receptor [Acidobacteriota bacterium]